jgi:predicted RNA-binding protein with PUA-like domain
MATFLLKTEPGAYSFDQLVADKKATWDGISSNAALAHLRTVRKGDQAFIYHTGDEKAIVGLAEFTSSTRPSSTDPTLTAAGEPKSPVVDLRPVRAAKTRVTLASLKADKRFADFALIRQSRLSVMPVPTALDAILRKLAGL